MKLGDQILRSSKILTFAFTKVFLQNQPMCICFKITQSISIAKPTKVYLLQDKPKYICLLQNPPKYIHTREVIFLLKSLRNFVASFALLLHTCWNDFFVENAFSFELWSTEDRFFEVPLFRIWEIGVKIIDRLANLMTNWCQNAWSFGKFGWCPNTWTMNFEIGVKVLDILANWWQICVKILNLLTNLLTNRCQNTWSFVKSVRKLKDTGCFFLLFRPKND